MDPELERALSASRADQDEEREEERQLREAIRLSLVDSGTSEINEVAEKKIGSHAQKRKAEDESTTTATKVAKRDQDASASSSQHPPMAYANGGIRITRTPGRAGSKNSVNLRDLVHKEHLKSACIYAFFIADEEIFPMLPLSRSSNEVPVSLPHLCVSTFHSLALIHGQIYVGRDPNMDEMIDVANDQARGSFNGKISRKELDSMRPALRQLYSQKYGSNFHVFHAWSPGCAHSKMLMLVYSNFMRIVITSCNMLLMDTDLNDNHWYIHDVPKLPKRSNATPYGFETDLLCHAEALGVPAEFLDTVRGVYDYSSVKVHLVTSVPGTHSGAKAERHGLLRLRHLVKKLDVDLLEQEKNGELNLEVCTASVGRLTAKWLNGFYDCALGTEAIAAMNDGCAVPGIKLFYPTRKDVQDADESAKDAAMSIGCHIHPWKDAPDAIRWLFHHYESKDHGRLFHQKFLLAYNSCNSSQLPYYIYMGSANLSQSAWGALEIDKRGNEATCGTKLVKMTNFECGVLVPGNLINDLLEPGTSSWQDGIVAHNQDASQWDIHKDKPWNDERWVTN
ncbi:tyrosyl-DNA phosphodiesterase-domain-containing protein [Xylariaceae sp. FL0016]|nr:tyrosyl-DNA phosphodiesterase-domain-containing protein [Xylariaceae sp. FL0016]